MIYLYSLQVQDNIKYIGLTKNPTRREQDHRRRRKTTHIFSIIETFDDVMAASDREAKLITKYGTVVDGWNISPGGDYEGASGYCRKGIGGVKKGCTTWNKGKKGCFSEETIQKFCDKRKGVIHSSKLDEITVRGIRQRFAEYTPTADVGNTMSNGKKMTKEREFANILHEEYNITDINLYNIVCRKSWKNIT